MEGTQAKTLYMFLDESGNLDFSEKGTRHFLLTAVTKERPFNAFRDLVDLKYDLIESGLGIEYFHASEDRQEVRNKVFSIIQRHMEGVRVDSIAVEKAKTHVELRSPERFYPNVLGFLIKAVLGDMPLAGYQEVIIMTDSVPVQKRRDAIAKAVKLTLADTLPPGVRHRIYHHESKSNLDLQVADYCCWAIYRKLASGDERSYSLIRDAVGRKLGG